MKNREIDEQLEDQVLAALKKVIDPELGVDLVSLGLIYNISCHESQCIIDMTLTTVGCPLTEWLNKDINEAVTAVEGIDTCKINLVWEPAWSIDRISRSARYLLGI
ncbi:metal-sulfur cluster assembly factor [Xylocopilactobacillus apis]|uniref:DNA methyltransferase n=1 Tax=Xylocopilactobacillus apis TaxID=2932183 RepID=A0AAU9CPZ0_9LACO|nr:metal-sulfur cluster assembly factor [Xylocopilactobacillus apis]BDR56009.1 DNA methyltransferase [Xylocopilactobacillus apis]